MSFAHITLQSAVSLPREHLAAIQHIFNDAVALQSSATRPPPPPYHPLQPRRDSSSSAWFKPRMDLFESHSGSGARPLITATFELPGLRKEDVHIDVLDNHMIVAGDRRHLPSATPSASAAAAHGSAQDEEMRDVDGLDGATSAVRTTAMTMTTDGGTKEEDARVSVSLTDQPREGYTVREIKRGRFKRVVPLPAGTKFEDVKASMHDGILTVTFPGSERPVPHSIPVA